VNIIPEKFVDLLSTFAMVSEVNTQINDEFPDILIWDTADPYIYMRTTDDGRILVGGEDEEFINPIKRDELIGKKTKKLEKTFHKYFPKANFYTDFSWAGTFGETKDGLPYIGEHKDFKNSYFVLGFGGNGITFSVIGMKMVSDWLKNQEHSLSQWFKFGR
jgi:glycine/D-amino acid oxidase-like deaminating enzyme